MRLAQFEAQDLADSLVGVVEDAPLIESPFAHLEFKQVFPEEIYQAMIRAMPVDAAYRAAGGQGRRARADGSATRVKIDLLPEQIRRLPREDQQIWSLVGTALRNPKLKSAFVRRFTPTLKARFGSAYADTPLFPIPTLTRDIPDYNLAPHCDHPTKCITVQLYLPASSDNAHLGTVFNTKVAEKSYASVAQMRFIPNAGYAFARAEDTWHSVDRVEFVVAGRDSILLTYYLDTAPWRFAINRAKRTSNFVVDSIRGSARNG